jgi:hypothetical protein
MDLKGALGMPTQMWFWLPAIAAILTFGLVMRVREWRRARALRLNEERAGAERLMRALEIAANQQHAQGVYTGDGFSVHKGAQGSTVYIGSDNPVSAIDRRDSR